MKESLQSANTLIEQTDGGGGGGSTCAYLGRGLLQYIARVQSATVMRV